MIVPSSTSSTTKVQLLMTACSFASVPNSSSNSRAQAVPTVSIASQSRKRRSGTTVLKNGPKKVKNQPMTISPLLSLYRLYICSET